MAFLYNFWVIIFRFSFAEITSETLLIWFCLDYFMDLIYFLDIVFHFRTGYLEVSEGFYLHTRGPWTATPALIKVESTGKK